MSPDSPYELTKSIWTDADFDQMSWHDVDVSAVAWWDDDQGSQFLLDIDYIFKWVLPVPPESGYTFWIAPCTLVFHQVEEFTCELKSYVGLEIFGLERELIPPEERSGGIQGDEWQYKFMMTWGGHITFRSTGYTQYTRKVPIHNTNQCLSGDQRGGISFDCPEVPLPSE